MKKHLLISVFTLTFFITKTQAQFQSIFNSGGTSWVSYGCLLLSAPCGKDSTYIVANSDTIINGKKFLAGTASISNFFISEDTTSGEVWYKSANPSDTFITKIMQMNLTLGDTFKFFNSHSIVDSVYWLNGKKHIRLDTLFSFTINGISTLIKYTMIEGVGTNVFGVNRDRNFTNTALICQKKNGVLNYQTSIDSTLSCDLVTGLSRLVAEEVQFELYPNPANQVLHFNIDEEEKIKAIQLIDLQGRLLQDYATNDRALELTTIANGIYFLKIVTEKGQLIKKVSVQH